MSLASDPEKAEVNPNDSSVNVYTADQFIDAIRKPKDADYVKNGDGNTGTSNISNINVKRNINLTDSTYSRYKDHYVYGNSGFTPPTDNDVNNPARPYLNKSHYDNSVEWWDWYNFTVKHPDTLTINGEGHKIDFGMNNFALQYDAPQHYVFKNMTWYGDSFYGPFSINKNNTIFDYDNITYYGPQLVHSQSGNGSKINIYNNVNVHSVPENYAMTDNGNGFSSTPHPTESNSNGNNGNPQKTDPLIQDEQNM